MARKKKHEEHENHERWLVSYADFITLLFAFFVVMYSLSAVNEGKFRVLSESLVAAFNSTSKSLQPVQVGQPVKAPAAPVQRLDPLKSPPTVAPVEMIRPAPVTITPRMQAIKEMADAIERAMDPLIKADLLLVRRDSLWIEVEIKTSILFPSGSAQLQAEAIPILEKIAGILGKFPNAVHVEGFTDNVPINTVAFPSNWELSAARAASVVHLFMSAGMQPARMAAIGLGEYRPIADNSSEEGRNKNRRVVLVVLADGDASDVLEVSHAAVRNTHNALDAQGLPANADSEAAAPPDGSAPRSTGTPPVMTAPSSQIAPPIQKFPVINLPQPIPSDPAVPSGGARREGGSP
jgi:chemotaxis protein MotB